MNNTLDIFRVAELVIAAGRRSSYFVSPLKLQKMLYYIQAWYAVHMDEQNVFGDDELPQAWANGPVYPEVYRKYRHSEEIGMYTVIDSKIESYDEIIKDLNLSEEQRDLIENIIETYQSKTHDELVFLTHCEDPWIDARKNLPPFAKSNEKITLESMFNYYRRRIEQK